MSLLFNLNTIPLHPMDCGRAYDEVSDEELRSLKPELDEEEMKSHFYKYFPKEMPMPSQEILDAINNGPMDPRDAFLPAQTGEIMLNGGHMKTEMGYCVLPNGVGYAAITIQQPGRNNENMEKFNKKFAPVGSLAYKIWFPGCHLMHFTDGAYEDFGWGPQKLRFGKPIDMKYLGIDEDKILEKDPDTIFFMANSTTAYNPFDPEKRNEYSIMMRHIRKTENGRELRIRYWFGMAYDNDGNIVTSLKPGESTPLENMYLMCKHCGYEYTHELKLVDELWNDPMVK